MDERARIAMLARAFGRSSAAIATMNGIEAAIGDDAAVLEGLRGRLVWTIDEQVEGTHFRRELVSWHDVGWRSFMAAASDVAAMGANPWCALCALALPPSVDDDALEQIALGQRDAAAALGAPVVGGNLARSGVLSIATTLLGTCERAVMRRGACRGDGIWLGGEVGLAAAGLRALETGRSEDPRLRRAVDAWRLPRALIAEGLAMAGVAHAAIDVSDGLARDSGHIADASGVRIVLYEDCLATSPSLVDGAAALGIDAVDLALHGGEDYAIVVASPQPIEGFRRIGEVRDGSGLTLRGAAGERPIEPEGFDHFKTDTRSEA
jgi:thiamine-monophosphate kinase